LKQQSLKSEHLYLNHNLCWLRKKYGISQKLMAELLGISLYSLRRLEQGFLPETVGVEILFCIHKHLGIDPGDFISHPFSK